MAVLILKGLNGSQIKVLRTVGPGVGEGFQVFTRRKLEVIGQTMYMANHIFRFLFGAIFPDINVVREHHKVTDSVHLDHLHQPWRNDNLNRKRSSN